MISQLLPFPLSRPLWRSEKPNQPGAHPVCRRGWWMTLDGCLGQIRWPLQKRRTLPLCCQQEVILRVSPPALRRRERTKGVQTSSSLGGVRPHFFPGDIYSKISRQTFRKCMKYPLSAQLGDYQPSASWRTLLYLSGAPQIQTMEVVYWGQCSFITWTSNQRLKFVCPVTPFPISVHSIFSPRAVYVTAV